MAGFSRRPKPLKAKTTLDDVVGVDLSGASTGDTLIYNAGDGEFHASHSFTGLAYTFAGSIQADSGTFDNDLAVGDDLAVGGDVFVAGDVSITDDLTADLATFQTLHILGNSVFDGLVSIAGTLSFAGFSISGSGTIGGSLTVADDITVSDDLLVGGDLTVAGNTTLHQLAVVGNEFITGNLNVTGSVAGDAIVGTTVAAATVLSAGTELDIGDAVYTSNGIFFEDDGTSIDILNGAATILSLRTAGIVEGSGVPALPAENGSLFLRTDGGDSDSLYVRTGGTWLPLSADHEDVDFLLADYFARQDLTITGEIQTGGMHADLLIAEQWEGDSGTEYVRIADGAIVMRQGGLERLRVNSSGQVIVTGGGFDYVVPETQTGQVQDIVCSGPASILSFDRYSNDSVSPGFSFRKSRGASNGQHGALVAGDGIGQLFSYGSDGTAYHLTTAILAGAGGPVSAGVVPGVMLFYTAPMGGGLSERLVLTADGMVSIRGGNKLHVTDSFGTGAQTATFTATNKPGSGTTAPSQWLTVSLNGTDYYIPCFL